MYAAGVMPDVASVARNPHWFDVTALWQMPQGNVGLRGPGLSSMSCMNRSRQM